MVRKKILIFIGLLFFFSGCINFYHHSKGGFRPKNPKFTLNKQKFYYNNQIDTAAIYVKTDTLKYGKFKRVFFLKFFNNGRFFKSNNNTNRPLNKSNLIPGDIGYYYILNKQKISIEYFIVDPSNKKKTEYITQKGVLSGDSIFLDNRFIKGKKDIYIKQKLNFIPIPSNW